MSNYKRYFSDNAKPVFITFVTYNRRDILIPNIEILRNSFKYVKSQYNFSIIAISILQNHCHMLIEADNTKNIPKIIRSIKYNFSHNISDEYICNDLTESAIKRGEKGIWQRRYYDHIIRNEEDLKRHIDYIHYNSYKHYKIYPRDWQYSSFKLFVHKNYYDINWCNFDNKYKITQLEYE